MLSKLPFEYCNDYNKWFKIALYTCYNDNPNNYEIFDKWSQQSKKYDAINNKKQWDNLKKNEGENKLLLLLLFIG